jgi:hypothetical protein
MTAAPSMQELGPGTFGCPPDQPTAEQDRRRQGDSPSERYGHRRYAERRHGHDYREIVRAGVAAMGATAAAGIEDGHLAIPASHLEARPGGNPGIAFGARPWHNALASPVQHPTRARVRGCVMLDYIVFAMAAVAGVALFVLGEALPTLLPRRIAYALLGLILIGLAIYLSLRG